MNAATRLISAQGARALRSLSAQRVGPGEEARLRNLAHGLARDAGVTPPSLWLIPDGGANALVCWHASAVAAVTTGLVESYSRTELEAVVAHCLARIVRGDARRACVAVALGPLGRALAPCVGCEDDLRAAAITRYPPALAEAIRKASSRGGRLAPMWFVADAPSHRPVEERIEQLRDL